MSFLFLKDGDVLPTEEGALIPQLKAVYNADKTEGKRFYKDVLLYVYFVYNQSHTYRDMFEDYRKKVVIERHLPKRKTEDFESNSRVAALINEYLERQLSKSERLLYQLEKDMESLLKRVSSIPYTKKVKTKIKWVNPEGEETLIPVEVEMDNSEEKEKTIRLAERMIDYADKLRAKVVKEKTDKKQNSTARLFDKKMK